MVVRHLTLSKRVVPHQRQTGPWLDSKLKALQEGAGEEVTQLKKKVEELEAAVRKLEDKQRDAEEEKKANAASAAATKAQ